ncbi:hypothetical protein GTU79_25355 [Sodalis ligni]|uniref:hypothetical protein n=1 Tax=Sodalis ligni TaxID=2697027 RepID=UPI00193F1064|nr:hypothetical protein [Sodalis ligni]QWA10491.1 hypothetical protein GTU79_25355 [Sodalis ligni]
MNSRALATIAVVMILTGCTSSPMKSTKKDNPGGKYLTQVANPGCLPHASLNNTLTPPVLYQGMVSCIKANNLNDGALLFALAGTYSYFDALRVDTDQARQAHSSMLGEALKSINNDQRQAFWRAINARFSNKQQLAALCRQVQDIGKPIYAPAYVLTGRENAGAGDITLWNSALNGYMHCATDVLNIR